MPKTNDKITINAAEDEQRATDGLYFKFYEYQLKFPQKKSSEISKIKARICSVLFFRVVFELYLVNYLHFKAHQSVYFRPLCCDALDFIISSFQSHLKQIETNQKCNTCTYIM